MNQYKVQVASAEHLHLAEAICLEMEESAKARGTGIAKRSPQYLRDKINEGKAIIAIDDNGAFVGFCYIETWSHGQFVANSGLIVSPKYRKGGLAHAIKQEIFNLSRKLYPKAKIFGLTTGLAVMKINSDLGYEPVSYSELTQDEDFWKGCQSCVNYEILMSKNRQNCLCTAMLYDPQAKKNHTEDLALRDDFEKELKLFDRWVRLKKFVMLKLTKSKDTLKSIFL